MLKFVFHIFKDSDGWGICMILKIFFDTNAFTVLFTKQGDVLPVAWTVFRDHLGCQLPFTAYGHFSISPELYQANLGSHEAVSSVNTALSLFRSWYIAHKCCSVIGQKSAAVDLYTLSGYPQGLVGAKSILQQPGQLALLATNMVLLMYAHSG